MSAISIIWLLFALFSHACDGFAPAVLKSSIRPMSSKIFMAGFGKPKELAKAEVSRIPSGATLCACGSRKEYQECCKVQHDSNGSSNSSPVDIVRARFTSLVYGIAPFLMQTTHPDNKEFEADDDTLKIGSKKTKREIWTKEIKAFADAFEFQNLSFEDEARDSSPPSMTEDAIVVVKLERKLRTAFKWDKIDERIRLRVNPLTGVWSVVSSILELEPAVESKMIKSSGKFL